MSLVSRNIENQEAFWPTIVIEVRPAVNNSNTMALTICFNGKSKSSDTAANYQDR